MSERLEPPVGAVLKDAGLVGDAIVVEDPAPPRQGRARGIALLAVLWGLALISLLLAGFLATSRTELRLAANLRNNAEAEALAEAGIARAVLGRLDPLPARRWRADSTLYRLAEGNGELEISLTAEAGKVDLNLAPPELLVGLMRALGIDGERADALAKAIVAFRTSDEADRVEAETYQAAAQASEPKNAAFDAVEELQQVIGVTPAIYRRLRPFVTVFGSQGIQPLFAAPEVLRAIPGMDGAALDGFLAARAASQWGECDGPDPSDETGDDEPLTTGFNDSADESGGENNAIAQDAQNQALAEQDQLSAAGFYGKRFREALPKGNGVLGYYDLAAQPTLIGIRVSALTQGGARFVREAVVNLTPSAGRAYSVVTWTRDAD